MPLSCNLDWCAITVEHTTCERERGSDAVLHIPGNYGRGSAGEPPAFTGIGPAARVRYTVISVCPMRHHAPRALVSSLPFDPSW